MKGKSIGKLIILLVIAIGLSAISYFGIGENNVLGVENIRQGLDLKGGVSILYEADKVSPTVEEMSSAQSLIQGRLDRLGYTESEVAIQNGNRLRVDIPGVEDAEQVIEEIGQTAMLYFVDEDFNVVLTGDYITNASKQSVTMTQGGIPQVVVSLEFNSEGKELFKQATEANIGKVIRILLDDAIISEPKVNETISDGSAIITGSFTPQEGEELAALIRAGSLPFALNVIYMSNVGAKLGAEALSTSLIAGAAGLILVLLFMIIAYKMLGVAADFALAIYVGIVLVILSAFRITLTLPGIAGIILTIGMAVDANVVIFERIREELNAGKTLKASVDAGFKRALPAILDGNVTTLIAAFVLFWFGSGPVKGFAQTLAIGIAVSMFSALVLTRIIINALVNSGIHNPNLYSKKVAN